MKSRSARLVRRVLLVYARTAALRLERAPDPRPRVYILLMHAWGMGGTIRTSLNLAGYLAQRHDVEVLSMVRRRDQPFFPFPAGVTVTAIDDQRPGARGWAGRALGRYGTVLFPRVDRASRAVSLRTDIALARMLRRRSRGVLIATRPGLNLLAASAAPDSLTKIAQEHLHFDAHKRPAKRALVTGYRDLDAVVALTVADARTYRKALTGPIVEAIPNAVPDLGGVQASGAEPVVLAAGRLTRQKGFGDLIRAFAQVADVHPEWTLLICGRGPRRAALMRLVAELGLDDKVVIAGPVNRIGLTMAGASIFALSSRFEGFPMVLLEAMSVGLPVVSFDCPTGPRELVEHGANGLLAPNGDVDALAQALIEMIGDRELRRRCAAGALETAERYSMERVGPSWESLIARLAGAPESTPADGIAAAGVV